MLVYFFVEAQSKTMIYCNNTLTDGNGMQLQSNKVGFDRITQHEYYGSLNSQIELPNDERPPAGRASNANRLSLPVRQSGRSGATKA